MNIILNGLTNPSSIISFNNVPTILKIDSNGDGTKAKLELTVSKESIKNMEKEDSTNIELPEIAQEALKEVKNAAKVAETIETSNIELSKEKINETLDKLSDLERKLDEDIAKKMSSLTDKQKNTLSKSRLFDFDTFWSGISNGWD